LSLSRAVSSARHEEGKEKDKSESTGSPLSISSLTSKISLILSVSLYGSARSRFLLGYGAAMTIDFPEWDEMAAEPEKLVVKLEEGIAGLQEQVRLLRERLKTAKRLVEVKADVEYLKQHNAPRPKGRSAGQGESDDHQPDGVGESAGLTRKTQVVQLLGQQPRRRWKAAEIAEALDIDNLKSMRTSLDEFARSGIIRKNLDDKTYQADPDE
jgi:hypothetical protein